MSHGPSNPNHTLDLNKSTDPFNPIQWLDQKWFKIKNQIEYLYSILFMVVGAIMYVPFVHFGYVFEFMDKLTTFLQLMLQIAPPCGLPVVYLWSTSHKSDKRKK